jgi:hypothetical protein
MYLPPAAQTVVLNDSAGDLNHAEAALNQGKRVWVVYGHAGQSADKMAFSKFFAGANALGRPSMTQVAGGRIMIALYDPANPNGTGAAE